MRKLIDITNHKYGNWTVLSRDKTNLNGKSKWVCSCSCGTIKSVFSSDLRNGKSKSCSFCNNGINQDYTGSIFHDLTVIKLNETRNNGRMWKCICKCGNIEIIKTNNLIHGKIKSCRDCRRRPVSSVWSKCKVESKTRNIQFSITIEDVWQQFIKQSKKCALSGIDLKVATQHQIKYHNKENTISIDRIDSSKGYEVGNIQLVHKHLNMMKWELTQKEFIKYCRLVVKNFDTY